jgi:hypothetical protein
LHGADHCMEQTIAWSRPLHGAGHCMEQAIAWSIRSREARRGFVLSPVPKCEGSGAPGTIAWSIRSRGSVKDVPKQCVNEVMRPNSEGSPPHEPIPVRGGPGPGAPGDLRAGCR